MTNTGALVFSVLTCLATAVPCRAQTAVGPEKGGGTTVTSGHLVRPAGETVEFPARPVDFVRSKDGRFVFVKEHKGVTVVKTADWSLGERVGLGDDAASMTGIALSEDGTRLYVTDATTGLHELAVASDGKLSKSRVIKLPGGKDGKGNSFPCGVTLLRDGKTALVCLSRNNSLGVVDLESGALRTEVAVGVAPFAVVVSPDESMAYVSVWGGRRPVEGERTSASAGTPALVDERGVAASGGLSVVNLKESKEVGYVDTGLSASSMTLTRDGATLFVTNSNSDTVSIVDVAARHVARQIVVKPDLALPFGSMPSAVALSADEKRLFVACAGNNAVAVIDSTGLWSDEPKISGWIPTGWYPGAVSVAGDELIVANIKGVGSRTARADGSFNSRRHRGSLQRVKAAGAEELARMTNQVKRDARVPQVLREIEARSDGEADAPAPTPVPARAGERSPIQHVIYIIKENRTYDQLLGDLASGDKPRGNGKPELCVYGRDVTPNQHALVEKYVLLDNYYCNGVLSADGHSWATEGNSTPYLERSFGGFKRTYTYGDDPLTYSSSGFVWDHVLAAGLSFRNFGELMEASIKPPEGASGKSWKDVYADWKSGANKYTFPETTGIDKLSRYTDHGAPGWNLDITDQIRADHFIAALKKFQEEGSMPNFITLHLPNDHTNGVSEGHPTPRAYVADNDLALGRIVEAVSKSKFWGTTAMFINEDDPQDGWDHVDGHRSICLVVSPYAKRGAVVSEFYNQAGVVHTIERIFGLAAANQGYGGAPLMGGCFTTEADLSTYAALTPAVAIDEMNPPRPKPGAKPGDGPAPPSQKGTPAAEVVGRELTLADLYTLTDRQDFSKPDRVNEGEFNLVLWYAARGFREPFPVAFAGGHGTGLEELGLELGGEDDDDDDDE